MGCLLLHRTLSAKRAERKAGGTAWRLSMERTVCACTARLGRCDSSSSPSPLGQSQPILLKPCPNFVPVLQPSQLCVKQEPQRTVSFAAGRDQDFWRHISWKQQLGTRTAGSSYDLRDSISAVGFTPCRRALLQDLPVLGFPINIGYSYFVRSMFRKWDLSKKKKRQDPPSPFPYTHKR